MEKLTDLQLGATLQQMGERYRWHHARWLMVIESLWREIVGESIFQHTAILTLTTNGALIVAVPSSVWSQELLYHKPTILEGIHSRAPNIPIHELRTQVRAQWAYHSPAQTSAVYSPYFETTQRAVVSSVNLPELLLRVQENYEMAAQAWLSEGFQPCQRCQAPTLKGYSLCIVCELSDR